MTGKAVFRDGSRAVDGRKRDAFIGVCGAVQCGAGCVLACAGGRAGGSSGPVNYRNALYGTGRRSLAV